MGGTRNKGDVVVGSSTGSGWLRLADRSGYMLLNGRHLGLGTLLAPLPPTPKTTAASQPAPKPAAHPASKAQKPLEPVSSRDVSTKSRKSSGEDHAHRARSNTSMYDTLPKEEPVLVECAANAANVASPLESCQHWEATPDGGFVRLALSE